MVQQRVTSRAAEVGVASDQVVKHAHFGLLRGLLADTLHVRCHAACGRTTAHAVVAVQWRA